MRLSYLHIRDDKECTVIYTLQPDGSVQVDHSMGCCRQTFRASKPYSEGEFKVIFDVNRRMAGGRVQNLES